MRLLLLIPALLAALAGCSGPAPSRPAEGTPARPAALSHEIGIEANVWRVVAVGGPTLQSLADYAEQVAQNSELERWSESGLRLIEIPIELVVTLEAGLPHVDAVRRHWLGQPTRWSRLASAPSPAPPSDLLSPGPGRVELLTRCWAEPGLRSGQGFRVELAVAWSPASARSASGREQIPDLYLSRHIPVGRALAIVPAAPGEDWSPLEPAPPGEGEPGPDIEREHDPEDEGVAALPAPAPAPGPDRDDPAGPILPSPPSVGERMLMTPAVLGDRPVPARRDVFVLVPRWP